MVAKTDDQRGEFEIQSDGTPFGTTVRDLETGQSFRDVKAVSFKHEAGSLPELTVTLIGDVKLRGFGRVQTVHGRTIGATKKGP